MSFAWAAFTVSFSVCVFLQYANPESLPFSLIAYPGRRNSRVFIMLFAGFTSFVGIVLMGIAVAMLNLRNENTANQPHSRFHMSWRGILFLLPVLFIYGMSNMHFYAQKGAHIWRQWSGKIRNPFYPYKN